MQTADGDNPDAWNVWYRSSNDGGTTWSSPVKLSDAPAGTAGYINANGFDEIYGNFTKFVEASDWYYFDGLKHYTELMRMNPETAGFVSWLFDSAPHPVGSIDFYKDKKVVKTDKGATKGDPCVGEEKRRVVRQAGEVVADKNALE